MLANPPYGKSWKTDLDRFCDGNKSELHDSRFVISHNGNNEFSLVTCSNDGQLMFLVNMLSKMKTDIPLGSRVATVQNGSALFTGDAGQGESNIRQWFIEARAYCYLKVTGKLVRGVGFEPTNLYRIGASGLRL